MFIEFQSYGAFLHKTLIRLFIKVTLCRGGGEGGGWVGRVLLDICLEWVMLFLKFSFSSWNQKQYLQEGKGFLPASCTALFIPIIETIINLRCKSPVRPCNDFRLNSGQVNNTSNRKNIFVWKQWPITEKKYTKHNYPISDQNHQNPLSLHKDILPSLRVKSYHTLAPLFFSPMPPASAPSVPAQRSCMFI